MADAICYTLASINNWDCENYGHESGDRKWYMRTSGENHVTKDCTDIANEFPGIKGTSWIFPINFIMITQNKMVDGYHDLLIRGLRPLSPNKVHCDTTLYEPPKMRLRFHGTARVNFTEYGGASAPTHTRTRTLGGLQVQQMHSCHRE